MGDFYRGWRRKLGVVTLVLACVFMGAWIRGSAYFERVVVPHRETYSVFRSSNPVWPSCLGVTWAYHWINPMVGPFKILGPKWETFPTYSAERIKELVREDVLQKSSPEWAADGNWEWESYGFLLRTSRDFIILAIPFWFIVILLTLLSARMLLFKPRKMNQKKITEPNVVDGA